MNDHAPRLKAPSGTCDTHIHIYDGRFPTAATAKFVPADAPVAAYMKVRERLGIARTVVVQPTTYGTDNRCTLAAMAEIGASARGVATLDMSVTDDELARLDRLGMRGLRFFMLPGGAVGWDILEPMAARAAAIGWHIQLQLDGRTLPQHEAMLRRLPGTLVIDHVGKFLEPVPPSDPAFRVLLGLVEAGRTYVKLAAPYETSKIGAPWFDDVGALAKALTRAAPERMLWATNWPHPTPGIVKPDDAVVLDMLLDWVEDEATRRKVLVDNPARLYRY